MAVFFRGEERVSHPVHSLFDAIFVPINSLITI